MAGARWDPFRDLNMLQDRMIRRLDPAFKDSCPDSGIFGGIR